MRRNRQPNSKQLNLPLTTLNPLALPAEKRRQLDLALTELLLEAASTVEQIEQEGAEDAF